MEGEGPATAHGRVSEQLLEERPLTGEMGNKNTNLPKGPEAEATQEEGVPVDDATGKILSPSGCDCCVGLFQRLLFSATARCRGLVSKTSHRNILASSNSRCIRKSSA